ncbi:MAG: hypothetical protein U0575_07135 [Phycisphaerales bacterium]
MRCASRRRRRFRSAVAAPPSCGDAANGSCCSEHDGPFCDQAACCAAVCDLDRLCCTVQWDASCAQVAAVLPACGCAPPACPGSGCCFAAHGGVGCAIQSCCDAVCAVDGFCCATAWDATCASLASQVCCPTDLNHDGVIDGGDLGLFFLGLFGGPTSPATSTATE